LGGVELGRWGLSSGVLARPASCCRHLGSCDVDCQAMTLGLSNHLFNIIFSSEIDGKSLTEGKNNMFFGKGRLKVKKDY
jgi:hypothetical protein